jgi:hypothetical protein
VEEEFSHAPNQVTRGRGVHDTFVLPHSSTDIYKIRNRNRNGKKKNKYKICNKKNEINSVIISVGYRLAPEHRLPMAYDDCFSAVEWVCQQAAGIMSVQTQNPKDPEESWMTTYCDFSWCFLSGDSAGGNITHHFAMRAMKTDVKPPSTKC